MNAFNSITPPQLPNEIDTEIDKLEQVKGTLQMSVTGIAMIIAAALAAASSLNCREGRVPAAYDYDVDAYDETSDIYSDTTTFYDTRTPDGYVDTSSDAFPNIPLCDGLELSFEGQAAVARAEQATDGNYNVPADNQSQYWRNTIGGRLGDMVHVHSNNLGNIQSTWVSNNGNATTVQQGYTGYNRDAGQYTLQPLSTTIKSECPYPNAHIADCTLINLQVTDLAATNNRVIVEVVVNYFGEHPVSCDVYDNGVTREICLRDCNEQFSTAMGQALDQISRHPEYRP